MPLQARCTRFSMLDQENLLLSGIDIPCHIPIHIRESYDVLNATLAVCYISSPLVFNILS